MWVFDWLTTYFSRFPGRTFQKILNFFQIRHHKAHGRLVMEVCGVPLRLALREL